MCAWVPGHHTPVWAPTAQVERMRTVRRGRSPVDGCERCRGAGAGARCCGAGGFWAASSSRAWSSFHPARSAQLASPATTGTAAVANCAGSFRCSTGSPADVSKPQRPQKRTSRATLPPHWEQTLRTSLIVLRLPGISHLRLAGSIAPVLPSMQSWFCIHGLKGTRMGQKSVFPALRAYKPIHLTWENGAARTIIML